MNKKKIIKKTSIFLGIASAIVTIPTVTSAVTASKTNSEQKTNNSLGNNYSGVNNYKKGGTKNNETMNFDDILNGANKASISNPVYAFDENNQLVVPNINDELINNISSVGNISSNLNDLKNYKDQLNSIDDIKNKINFDDIEKSFSSAKNESLSNALNFFTEDQLNAKIEISDAHKQLIDYLLPNNSIISGDTTLKEAIESINNQAFSELENGTLNVDNVIKSVSAFGINLTEEVNKINSGTSDYIDINKLSNSGYFSSNLFGGGGQQKNQAANNASGSVSDITSSLNTSSNTDSTTMDQYSQLLTAVCALEGLSIGVCAAQILIDTVILILSFGTDLVVWADIIFNGYGIYCSTSSLIEASQKLKNLNDLIKDSNAWIDEELIPYIGRDISAWEVYQILKYKPKIYLQKMNVPEKYIEKTSSAFCDAFESLSKSPVYRKLSSVNSNYFKIEDLSPVSVALTLISVAIDTIITIISGIIEM